MIDLGCLAKEVVVQNRAIRCHQFQLVDPGSEEPMVLLTKNGVKSAKNGSLSKENRETFIF